MFLRLFFLISTLLIVKPLYAHTFTGMNGFYDGLSHPVLGLDHFLAMVCVGVVSSQIGGRAIWTVPSLFVLFMIVGGAAGLFIEILAITFSDIIEWGIIFSVIFLGLSVAIEKKITNNYYNDSSCIFWCVSWISSRYRNAMGGKSTIICVRFFIWHSSSSLIWSRHRIIVN